ncbi:MAG: efflux RND transporter periplasmic adaptor subunit [Xanthomonadales bacterium]|nr:efflux RND transporter periplasmic adaptor subunit [Gammaproteobacteria bacterium]MBT8052313.1 efflux RND transporter periplasmic adaptor subunit [Gammaproteobacteria bacterium]NND55971.1 efflux RND transporter periplasmic adaptor subunit [Xanthomonadales bacterium]NNK51537.1 efflux RND transporter periplasmic adaptor subunit [Xanthomonadales bacterium]
MKKFLRYSAPVLVLAAGFVIVQILVAAKPEPEKNDDEARPISLYVDEVKSETVTVSVKTQGEVRPKTEIDLIPQVSGRIVAMSESFREGAEFTPDSVLMKIDDTDYQLAAVRAEARVAEAQTALEREFATAKMKEEEWRDGRKDQEPTPFALNLTQVAEAEAKLLSARADLRKARLDLERTEIRVPFYGRVRDRTAGVGQVVTAGTKVGRVFSIDVAEIRLPLTDSQLVELKLPLGYKADDPLTAPQVNFRASLGSRDFFWKGHIVRVDAAVNQDTRLIYATSEVIDPYGLGATEGMPLAVGMFVSAEIEGVTEQAAYVMPRLALRNKDTVYVINDENRLEIRTVNVLSTSEDHVMVSSGVSPGEHVVTSTLPNAVDGMQAEPVFRQANG